MHPTRQRSVLSDALCHVTLDDQKPIDCAGWPACGVLFFLDAQHLSCCGVECARYRDEIGTQGNGFRKYRMDRTDCPKILDAAWQFIVARRKQLGVSGQTGAHGRDARRCADIRAMSVCSAIVESELMSGFLSARGAMVDDLHCARGCRSRNGSHIARPSSGCGRGQAHKSRRRPRSSETEEYAKSLAQYGILNPDHKYSITFFIVSHAPVRARWASRPQDTNSRCHGF